MVIINWKGLKNSSVSLVVLWMSIASPTIINNHYFDDNLRKTAYFTATPYGLIQCAKLCALDGRCTSINFHMEAYTCELVETSANLATDLGGWLSTSDFSFVAEKLGPCKSVTVQEADMCVRLKSGGNVLVTKYCPVPPAVPNGYVTPDQRTIGDNIALICGSCFGSGDSNDTCLANGQWSSGNAKCLPLYDIRLVGGSTAYEGRVEIFNDGTWGSVCDDNFGIQEAMVVCKQLGYSGGQAFSSAYFGEGSGQIWMDELQCTGNECMLPDCQFPGWGNEDCGHHEDVGVICS